MPIYIVKPGDSVDRIAGSYGISVEILTFDNQITYPYRLAVGQSLFIRSGVRNYFQKEIFSGGYAYPYIEPDILDETLTHLSELFVFSYGFTEQGDLRPPAIDDLPVVVKANGAGVRPYLTLTPMGEDGRFNNNLIHLLVNDERVQLRLIGQLLQTVEEKEYRGVDIDFEYIMAEDRIPYVEFVGKVTSIMNQFGYPVSVALAPKTSANQPGVLYEGMDYRLLGEAANHVLLMTYEWGYTYSAPMAVAPVNMVRRVVEYALSEIPAEKINLGIPNYGYDWALPYVQGTTKAESIGNVVAVERAIDFGSEIHFDSTAMSPYYRYWQYGIQHEVWFEDVRSIRAKYELVEEYGLRGAVYWQLMRLFRASWLLMEELFEIT